VARVHDGVRDMAEVNTVMWRLRNQRPPVASVERIADRWDAGADCAGVADAVVTPSAPVPARHLGLADAIHHHLRAPLYDGPLSPGDRAYLAGEYTSAALAYREQIARDPLSDEAWAGLAAALRHSGAQPAGAALALRPDLVRALYLREWTGPAPATPDALAAWIASGLPAARVGRQGDGGSM
jgi:hypothetical protein